jgi:hypothetical protein
MTACSCRRYGKMEYWNNGLRLGENIGNKSKNNLFQLLETFSNHYSIIPTGEKSLSSLLLF